MLRLPWWMKKPVASSAKNSGASGLSISGGRLGGPFIMMLSFFVVYAGPEDLPLLRPAHHHADIAAPAPRAHQPPAPISHGHLSAISLGHFVRVGLKLMPTVLAPYDECQSGRRGAAERCGRAAVGFHRRRRNSRLVPGFPIVIPPAIARGGRNLPLPFPVDLCGE